MFLFSDMHPVVACVLSLVLLLSPLATRPLENAGPDPTTNVTAYEGLPFRMPYSAPPLASAFWRVQGREPPCITRGNCQVLHENLVFSRVYPQDAAQYSVMEVTLSQARVLLFNLKVVPAASPIEVPTQTSTFVAIGPQRPVVPFSYYHTANNDTSIVLSCVRVSTRVVCETAPQCHYQRLHNNSLEFLADPGCDGMYYYADSTIVQPYYVRLYSVANYTERVNFGEPFFAAVDETQGAYPFNWTLNNTVVCKAANWSHFSCVRDQCEFELFGKYSLWGTARRGCAGVYVFTSAKQTVYVDVRINFKTHASLSVAPQSSVTLGIEDLPRHPFTWFYNSERIAFCTGPRTCEALAPFLLSNGVSLTFLASPHTAGHYTVTYNDDEWVGTYDVSLKQPVPSWRPRSLVTMKSVTRSVRQTERGRRVQLTVPAKGLSVYWYKVNGPFVFEKVAFCAQGKPVIVYNITDFDVNVHCDLLLLHVSDEGVFLSVTELLPKQYQLKLYAVTFKRLSFETAVSAVLASPLSPPVIRNDTFRLFSLEHSLATFVKRCDLSQCFALAPPDTSLALSLFNRRHLVIYGIYKPEHRSRVARHLLSIADNSTTSSVATPAPPSSPVTSTTASDTDLTFTTEESYIVSHKQDTLEIITDSNRSYTPPPVDDEDYSGSNYFPPPSYHQCPPTVDPGLLLFFFVSLLAFWAVLGALVVRLCYLCFCKRSMRYPLGRENVSL